MKNKFLKILFVFGILFYSINSFAAWTSIGTSVNYQETGNTGKVAAIIYTGCGVSDTGAKAWADALYNSVLKNKGVGYLYAVSLPASYGCDKINTPISNTKIISDLKDKYGKSLVTNTVVIMHSSGAYIANEFFSKALAEESTFKKTFTVFNVDGDNGINVYAAKLFNKSYPVAGKSGSLNSRNSAVTGTETKIVIDLPGCSTADCIHMKLINKDSSVSSVTTDFAKIDPAYSSTTTNNVTNLYLDKLTNVSVSTTGSGGGTTPLVGSGAANTSTTLTAKTFNEQTGINASAGSYELISPIGNLSELCDVGDLVYKDGNVVKDKDGKSLCCLSGEVEKNKNTGEIQCKEPVGKTESKGFSNFVNLLIRIAIALAGAIAVVMLIIGGIQYMGTDSVWEKGESRSRMTSAIIGLVLLLTSYFILFNINPDLVDIRIGGLRVTEGEWDIEFGDGGAQYLTNGKLTPGSTTKNCPEGFTNAGPFISCKSIAKNIENMVAAAKKDGIILGGGGFRTKEQQIELRKKNCGGDVDTKKSTECNPPTAKPGTSRHESGKAFDLTCEGKSMAGSKCFTWLQNNAAKYGLQNYKAEPWHWSTDGH